MCKSNGRNSQLASQSLKAQSRSFVNQPSCPFPAPGSGQRGTLQLVSLAASLVMLAEAFSPFESALAAEPQAPATSSQLMSDSNPKPASSDAHTLVAMVPDSSTRTSDVLTRKILLDEIALEKFNLNYRLQTGKVDRWKGTRYFLLQEANIAMLDGGFIATVAERSKHLSSPQHANIVTLEHALIPRIVGPFLAVSSSLLELGIDGWHDHKLNKTEFSPVTAKEHVISLRAEIDRLLKEREAAVQQEQSDPANVSSRVQAAEGEVLRDARDLSLAEFERFHIGASKFSAFEKSLYALNIASMGTLASAEIIPMVAAYQRDGSLDGPAAVLAIIVGSVFMATPIVGRSIGKLAGIRDKHFLKECSGDVVARDMAKLDADRDRLKQLCQASGSNETEAGATARLAVYESQGKNFRDRLEAASNELKAGRRVATQNVLSGALVGGSVIGAESAISVAGFHYATNARRFNTLADAGSITIVGALSYAGLDNLRIHTQAELNKRKLSRKGLLPRQALEGRLKELDEIEATLKKSPGATQ
jgi:hypothetical protein